MRIPLPILLDVPTLTISVFAAYLGSALFVALLYASRRRFPGAHLWITGQALLALGAAGVAIQAFGIPYAALAVSNVALIASVVFFGHAIWIFRFTVRFPSWTYAVIPLSLVAWLLMEGSGVGLRIIVFSGTLSVLSGLVAASLLVPDRSGPSPGFRIASVYFIAVAATGLLRVLSVLLDDAPLSIADEGAMGSLVYLLALLVAFFNLFSYYLFSSAVVERDLRVREQEIRVRNEELLETIGTKDALIAVIGHDLRAPVWSATRYVRSHLVEFEGDLNSKRESIETLAEGLERISSLLDSLLEWALCASGRIKLQAEPLVVEDVLSETIADMSSITSAKAVSVPAPVGSGTILADRRALATVFRNLLSNAVKYSRKDSSIRCSVSLSEKRDAVVVSIEDSGVGMKPDQIAKLFVPGRTMLTLGTGGEQGKGFGLAISKLFVEAMGGEIRVWSEYGAGTRFELYFPIAPTIGE